MHVDDHFANTRLAQPAQRDFQQSVSTDFDEGLRTIVGERTQARAEARGEDHGLHGCDLLQFGLIPFEFFRLHPFQFAMPHDHFYAIPSPQAFRDLLGQIHRTVLPTGAGKRHHKVLKAASLPLNHMGVNQRHHVSQKPMHTFLLIEILDHRSVFASESLETLFATGIRQAAAIENIASAISAVILRFSPRKREKLKIRTVKLSASEARPCKLLRGQHAVEGVHQGR